MYSTLQHSASIRSLLVTLEVTGLANFHRRRPVWKRWLQEVYCYCVYGILCLIMTFHCLSTFTRATRYVPEFCQCFFEDVAIWNFLLQLLFIKRRYKEVNRITHFMKSSFSRADQKIIHETNQRNETIMKVFFFNSITVLFFILADLLIPVPAEEVELNRVIYRTAHPRRKLPSKVKIPYVDETEWLAHCILSCFQFYLFLINLVMTSIASNMLPFLTFHLAAQYKILCQYIDKVGYPHYNALGEEIFYTNIETNEYRIKLPLRKRFRRPGLEEYQRYVYQRKYFIQIIKFHQKLLSFQQQITAFYEIPVILQTVNNYVNSALVLYQLVLCPSISPTRVYKFLGELISFHALNFYWCHCSELLDDCNRAVVSSLWASGWLACDMRLRKDMRMMVRCAQRANQLRFCHGTIRLGKAYFMHIIKIGYTFVNFARSSS